MDFKYKKYKIQISFFIIVINVMKGIVYLLTNPVMPGLTKIGKTSPDF